MGFAPRISFESDNPSVVRKMIGLGLGVGFWPEQSWGETKGEGVALLPLDIQQRREVYVWLSSSAVDNPCLARSMTTFAIIFGNVFLSRLVFGSLI